MTADGRLFPFVFSNVRVLQPKHVKKCLLDNNYKQINTAKSTTFPRKHHDFSVWAKGGVVVNPD